MLCLVHPSPVFVVSGRLHVFSWWHWIALICAFFGLVLRGTGICFCSVLWTVSVRQCGYLYYLCCSPSLLLPAVTALLSLPLHPEFLMYSPYKLLHLPKTCKVMGGHLNIQSHVQFTGHISISRGLRAVHHLWVWICMNVHYARKMALQFLSDGNEVILGGGWDVWMTAAEMMYVYVRGFAGLVIPLEG